MLKNDWPRPVTEIAPLVEDSVANCIVTPLPKVPSGSKPPLTVIDPLELLKRVPTSDTP